MPNLINCSLHSNFAEEVLLKHFNACIITVFTHKRIFLKLFFFFFKSIFNFSIGEKKGDFKYSTQTKTNSRDRSSQK